MSPTVLRAVDAMMAGGMSPSFDPQEGRCSCSPNANWSGKSHASQEENRENQGDTTKQLHADSSVFFSWVMQEKYIRKTRLNFHSLPVG
jgi:hypothetical protein